MDKILKQIALESQRLQSEGRTAEVIHLMERTAGECMNILALTRSQMGESRLPVRYLDMASKIDNNNWMVYNNLCHVHNTHFLFDEAKAAIMRAIECCGALSHDPYYNAGVVLQNLLETESAIAMYRKAVGIAPHVPICRYNLACSLLMHGNYKEGWEHYESRFDAFPKPQMMRSRFKSPTWVGEKLKGKKICVYSEQGVGDFIQFARFLPQVKAKGGHVTVEVQEDLAKLLGKNLKIDKVVPRKHAEGDWPTPEESDYSVSACSLGHIFGVDEQSMRSKPYFKGPPNKVKLPSKDFKIGFCYAGSPSHQNDYLRSCPMNLFRPLGELPGVQLYSLQKEDGIREWPHQPSVNLRADIEGMNYHDLAPFMKDFIRCADYIERMDLIITVDTSIAHLAGAMGKLTWLLLPTVSDWRWLEGREDSPWYPSMRIFRQKKFRDWNEVFGRVLTELSEVLDCQA